MEEYVWISRLTHRSTAVRRVRPVLDRLGQRYDVQIAVAQLDDSLSAERYVGAIQEATARGVAGIMIVGRNYPGAGDVIDKAVEAGIPIVTVGCDLTRCKRLAYVGTDWSALATAIADRTSQLQQGHGDLLVIGEQRLPGTTETYQCLCERLQANGSIRIGDLLDVDEENADHCQSRIRDFLGGLPGPHGIAAMNPTAAAAAVRVVRETADGRAARIVCVDIDESLQQYVQDGTISAAYCHKHEEIANSAFQLLFAYNHGSPATGHRRGSINIPGDIHTGIVVIDSSNVDTYEPSLAWNEGSERHELYQRLSLTSSMLENSTELALATDTNGRILYANPACSRLLGYTQKQLLDVGVDVAFDFDDQQRSCVVSCIAGGEACSFETSARRRDGSTFPVLFSASPLTAKAELRGLVVLASDISERHRAERALQETEERYHNLFRQSKDAIFIHDLEGNILDANEIASQLTEYPKAELLTLNIAQLHPSDEAEASRAAFEAIRRDGRVRFEIKFLGKSGTIFPAEVSSSLFEAGGRKLVQGIMRDITERKRTERALIEAERDKAVVLNSVSELVTYQDRDMRLIWANRAAGVSVDLSPDEIVGRRCHEVWQGRNTPCEGCPVVAAMNSGEVEDGEIETPDGRVWLIRGYPVKDERGRITGAVEVTREISERILAERQLRDSEERFRTIADHTYNWEDWVGLDGRPIWINPGVERVTGYAVDECMAMSSYPLPLIHEEDRDKVARLHEDESHCASGHGLKIRILHKQGRIVWGAVSWQAVINSDGLPLGWRTSIRDITEQKQAEEALLRSEHKYRELYENLRDGSAAVNMEGRIVECNSAFRKMLGYTLEELRQLTNEDITPPQWHAEEAGIINEQVLVRGYSDLYEKEYRRKDGSSFPSEMRTYLMRDELGKPSGMWAFVRDISERKQTEQHRLELQEKLERAERMEALGVLAGGVAHDLNNMLGPLLGYPELILAQLPADSPIRRQVTRIGKSAKEAADVIQDLLTLARRGRYDMTPTDPNEIVHACLNSPAFEALSKQNPQVRVSKQLDAQSPRIDGSVQHLTKALMNLVVNAYDAMPNGGELAISTCHRRLEKLIGGYEKIEPKDYVLLSVRDTGLGIDLESISKIFEPYFSKKKLGASGSGLGLPVVYGIIKDHLGYYDIISQPGQGCEFIVYLPVADDTEINDAPVTVSCEGSESILIVDDEESQREVAADLLTSLGYRVETVKSGNEAVAFLKGRGIDLVVLDMIMEKDFDGLDTFREILRYHPDQKAVIVSGFSETDRVNEMRRLGAGPYIRKPYTREVLGRAIREVLDRKEALAL